MIKKLYQQKKNQIIHYSIVVIWRTLVEPVWLIFLLFT